MADMSNREKDSNYPTLVSSNTKRYREANQNQEKTSTDYLEKNQLVVIIISALFVVLGFTAFLITKNDQLLLETSVLAYPFFRIIDYYFAKDKKGE